MLKKIVGLLFLNSQPEKLVVVGRQTFFSFKDSKTYFIVHVVVKNDKNNEQFL